MSSHVNRLPRIVENCRSSVRFCHQVDLLGIPFISEVGGGNVPFRAAKQTDRLRPNFGHCTETNTVNAAAAAFRRPSPLSERRQLGGKPTRPSASSD